MSKKKVNEYFKGKTMTVALDDDGIFGDMFLSVHIWRNEVTVRHFNECLYLDYQWKSDTKQWSMYDYDEGYTTVNQPPLSWDENNWVLVDAMIDAIKTGITL